MQAIARPGAGERLGELGRYRDLVWNLTLRDLRLRYRRSVLGAAWSVLNPLIMMAIYYVIFGVALHVFTLPQYWAFVLSGLVPWFFFANSAGSAATAFVQNSNLISKVYFPIESLSIAAVLSNFVNFLVSEVVLVAVVVIAGRPVGPSLVLLPVVVAAQLALTLGVSLLLSTLTVYFRDLEHLVGLALTAVFYLTPVLYPLGLAGRYQVYLKLNPLTWFLEGYHHVLYYGDWPNPVLVLAEVAIGAAALAAGYAVFARLRPRLPEEI